MSLDNHFPRSGYKHMIRVKRIVYFFPIGPFPKRYIFYYTFRDYQLLCKSEMLFPSTFSLALLKLGFNTFSKLAK